MTPFIMHPGAAPLQRFADGESSAREQRRVASHLSRCQRCRSSIASIRQLSARAAIVIAPEPSSDLFKRILDDRSAGKRVILPIENHRAPKELRVYAIAAGLVLFIGAVTYAGWSAQSNSAARRERSSSSTYSDSLDEPSSIPGMFMSRLLLPPTAGALEPSASSLSDIPRLSGIDGTRLPAGEYTFARRTTDSTGRSVNTGSGALRVTRTTFRGAEAWLITHSWSVNPGKDGVRSEAETLLVNRRNLRLLARSVHVSPYLRYNWLNISQEFNGDSVSGWMTAERPGGNARRAILQRLYRANGPYISDAFAPVLLASVQLRAGWAASLSLLGWAVRPSDVFYPAQLRITGEERVTVPAGEFDCWILTVTTSWNSHTYWVRKSDGVGIRTRLDTEAGRKLPDIHEIVLTHEAR